MREDPSFFSFVVDSSDLDLCVKYPPFDPSFFSFFFSFLSYFRYRAMWFFPSLSLYIYKFALPRFPFPRLIVNSRYFFCLSCAKRVPD